jgi:exodeoxyribonuclease X
MIRRIIDIETTGLAPTRGRIVELACVDVSPDGQIVGEQQALVKPGCRIPPEASAVHHLVDADVAEAPRIDEAVASFGGAAAYIAHNCKFERAFLEPLLGEQMWVCTYKCALRVWPDAPGHSNQVLRYWLGIEEPFGRARTTLLPHRAHSDALITAAIFLRLSKRASWEEMVRWTSEPALCSRLTFGRHRGESYAKVPLDYLEWIVSKSELDDDTKASAAYWIGTRTPVEAFKDMAFTRLGVDGAAEPGRVSPS